MHDEPEIPHLDQESVSDRPGGGMALPHLGKITNFGTKLEYLLNLCEVDRTTFERVLMGSGEPGRSRKRVVYDASAMTQRARAGRDPNRIDLRTIQNWFEEDRNVQRHAMEKIINFFADHGVRVRSPDFHCPLDEFCRRADTSFAVTSKQVRLKLAHSPNVLEETIITYLVGKYLMFRCSLGNTNMIVSEIGIIGRSGASSNMLTLDVYSPPASGRAVLNEIADAEHFVGNIFQFGKMFYSMVSIEGASDRIRFYHFPKLDVARWVHYGITSGYSANLAGEPVAARVVAIKIKVKTPLDDGDAALIGRHEPTSQVAASVGRLIDNTVNRSDAHILKVNQSEIVPVVRELETALQRLLAKAGAKKT